MDLCNDGTCRSRNSGKRRGKVKEGKCLTLLNINARRILNKLWPLEHFIDAYNSHDVCPTETGLNAMIRDHENLVFVPISDVTVDKTTFCTLQFSNT